jgi:chromosome segregation ATPase
LCTIYSKQTSIEIEQLNARVIEAETKLKSEIQRIKKKFQIQITELEMSLDVANHTNIDLQKTIKKQSLQLTELTALYEDLQRQLQATMDQYSIAQRRIQSLTGELEEMRSNYEQVMRQKRQVEISYEESQTRNSELSSINISLQNTRAKIEAELSTLASEYEEVTRELRVSDERYQKIQVRWGMERDFGGKLMSFFFRWSLSQPSKSLAKNRLALSRSRLSRSLWKLKSR